MNPFRLTAVSCGDQCVLSMHGEADLAVAEDIVELGTVGLNEPDIRTLVIDLHAVTFCDSTTISAFIRLRNHARDAGKQLVLSGIPDRIQQVLTIAGLGHVFTDDPARPLPA